MYIFQKPCGYVKNPWLGIPLFIGIPLFKGNCTMKCKEWKSGIPPPYFQGIMSSVHGACAVEAVFSTSSRTKFLRRKTKALDCKNTPY